MTGESLPVHKRAGDGLPRTPPGRAEEPPPAEDEGEISRVLSLVCVGVCAVMFGVGMLQHRDILDMFLTAVALAVAAIPEGLPAIVTIVLALGVQRLAGRRGPS